MKLSSLMKKKITPFLLLLLGFFILVYTGHVIVAGACFVLGLSMIINWIWPEKQEKKDDESK